MTERDFFEQNISMIAEMAVEAKKMDAQSRLDWKKEVLKAVPDQAAGFIKKVFISIETVLEEGGSKC